MDILEQIKHYAVQYYGVDWMVALAIFAGIFLLGNERKAGFIMGMLSVVFGLIFSFQIQSIANGIASFMLFILYLRGYLKWRHHGEIR